MVDKMIWVDIETTGLEPTIDALLEVALVVTDTRLHMIDSIARVIEPRKGFQELYALAGVYVQSMHENSGLWLALRNGKGVPAWTAESVFLEFMGDHFGDEKPPMCGSSVGFDRAFLKYHLNTLESRFSYRNIDVSSIKELAERWAPPIFMMRPGQAEEDKKHRAFEDTLASIDELRHYVDSGFINPITDPTGDQDNG